MDAGGLGSAEWVGRKLRASPCGRCGLELLLWATVRGGAGAAVPASEGRWGEFCTVGAEPRLCVCVCVVEWEVVGRWGSHFWLNVHPSVSRVPTRGKKNSKPPPQRAVFPQFSHLPISPSVICLCVCPPTTHLFLFPSTLINGSSTRFQGKGAGPGSVGLHVMLREPSGKSHQEEGIPAGS